MKRGEDSLKLEIKLIAEKFIEAIKDRDIEVISHFDTDGITSAAIMINALKELDKNFSLKIVKNLEGGLIRNLSKEKIILFLDLACGSLHHIEEAGLENVFIIDHHEIIKEIPKGIEIINPELCTKQKISSSCLTYLFCKEMISEDKQSAKLAVLGMIGDILEKEIDILNNGILNDGDIKRKRGLLIYPSTRPLNRTLEFCSNPYIPGVTGNAKGVTELLRECELAPKGGKYKSLIELDDSEMKKLITAVMLRNPKSGNKEMVGDIFLIKMFNKLEDARELSAKINACSRFGESETAIQLCLEIPKAMKRAETIHAKYKQLLITGLKFVSETEKIKGKGFVIINARDNVKETMIGTIASILSNSSLYEEGTMIIAMAYYENKIKISIRNVGRNGRNVREILNNVIDITGGDVGGHKFAAGCMIKKDKEKDFLDILRKNLEIEVVRI